MKLIFHGGALDVGRSCIELVTSKNRFLMDCGIKLGEETEYPEEPKGMKQINAVLLTHAHLDHSGALALFQKKGLKCPIYMAPGTENIAKILLKDNLKVESITHKPDYDKSNVYATANLFKIKDFRQDLQINDTRVRFYDAGHIPGSALVCIDADGKRLVYTGDINTTETRLMNGADLEIDDIDTLITETTYGAKEHPNRTQSEKELIAKIKETIKRGGKAVIPVFGLGRAQEILLLIHSEKWDVPVYLDGIAEDITNIVIQENTCRDVDKLAKARVKTIFVKGSNERQIAMKGDGIFITTSGMLAGGPIIDYLKETYANPLNSILLTGYVMENTNGGLLMKEGSVFLDGKKVKVKAEYKQFDFSAHAGMSELKQMIKTLNPKRVILVHGEPAALENMAAYVRSLGKEVFIPKPGSEINIRDHYIYEVNRQMKHKFKEFLENLDYNELLEFNKQLKDKGSVMRKVLDDHVDVTERINARVCATCGNQLDATSKNLVLHFGPEDIKKKASFCAFDCLEFFMDQLKSIEMKKIKNESSIK